MNADFSIRAAPVVPQGEGEPKRWAASNQR
jgi:hypothetical protein